MIISFPILKNIGLVFDEILSFKNHISSIKKSLQFSSLQNLKNMRVIFQKPFETLINALVIIRLDYCSSLMNLFPAKYTVSLNWIIYFLIRTYRIKRLDHFLTTYHQTSHMCLTFSLRCKLRFLSIIYISIHSFTLTISLIYFKKRTILPYLLYQNVPLIIFQNSSKTP